jgi:Secretion system C-terminal sorting domain
MKKYTRFSFLALILIGGVLLFEAQDFTSQLSDNNDKIYDKPTVESFSHFVAPGGPQRDVITDATGFDNFDIGNDQDEMDATTNPNNPLQMFFGVNSGPMNHRYTLDGGITWSISSLSYPGGTCCDPWTAYDSLGNLFYSVLTGSGNWVARSTNFGASFGTFVSAVAGTDRNSIAADQTGGPYANYVYAIDWANANFGRSTDHGATWTTTVPNFPNTTPGNMIAVGPNGNIQGGTVVFVSITGSNPAPSTFNFYKSTDGGATFTLVGPGAISPGYVGTLNSASRLVINNARTRPYPMIAMDNSYGAFRGRLYCVYASNNPAGNGNKPDIKCQFSNDGGATWSSAVTVNDDANSTTSDQWFPAVWCDKLTGKLYVKWYDTRNNPATYGVDVYASYSTTGGASFVTNQKLTNANWVYPCPACGANQNCYRGDYDAITSYKYSALAIWADMRTCSQTNMAAYFPDFAMTVLPSVQGMTGINDSVFSYVRVPSVKLYTDKVHYSSTINPAPGAGTMTVSFLNRTNSTLQDTLTAYPDSLKIRIKCTGGVTAGVYTVTVKAVGRIAGSDGVPVHVRNIVVTVNPLGVITIGTGVPEKFYLYQNYPNPFNPTTEIRFDVARAGNVKIGIYDITGRKVADLVNGNYEAGKYIADFNAANYASGVYFYKIETADYTSIRKMILIK